MSGHMDGTRYAEIARTQGLEDLGLSDDAPRCSPYCKSGRMRSGRGKNGALIYWCPVCETTAIPREPSLPSTLEALSAH